MYTICNTTQGDVLDAVKEMVKQGFKWPIAQVGQKHYRHLDNNRSKAPETVDSRPRKYMVNLVTETMHKDGCIITKSSLHENLVEASLVNVKAAGLKPCSVCMS